MASHCDSHQSGVIVELGAGTGAVTAALLQLGIKGITVNFIRLFPFLVNQLRQRFPQVQVVQGDAVELIALLKEEQRTINTFVSSLPLRTLPYSMTSTILRQIVALLASQGKYIQFTYSLRKTNFADLIQCRLIASKRVWRNFPPARVEVWEKL